MSVIISYHKTCKHFQTAVPLWSGDVEFHHVDYTEELSSIQSFISTHTDVMLNNRKGNGTKTRIPIQRYLQTYTIRSVKMSNALYAMYSYRQ